MPITAVLSFGSTTAERNADLGAWSMEAKVERPIRRQMVNASELGTGKSAKKTAEGRWVKTMVLTRPMRLETDEAKTFPIVEKNQVIDMIEPSWVSRR
jgi:hypothetical protein